MAEVGILAWGNREELVRGVVLDPAPLVRNRCHPLLKGGVTRFLNELEGTPEEFEGRIHKYTAEEYQEMGKAGILIKDDRVELIDGEIVQMPPIGSSHQETVDTVNEMFVSRFAPVARVRIQGPVRFADSSEPEPDIMLLERRTGSYRSSHPQPQNVLLAVEVSDSTLQSDRGRQCYILCALRHSGSMAPQPARWAARSPPKSQRRRLPGSHYSTTGRHGLATGVPRSGSQRDRPARMTDLPLVRYTNECCLIPWFPLSNTSNNGSKCMMLLCVRTKLGLGWP